MNLDYLPKISKLLSLAILPVLILALTIPGNMPVDAAPSQESPGLLFYDDFNDGNADGWTTSGEGAWYVANNEYVVDMDSIYGVEGLSLAGDSNWTNYVFDFDMMGEQAVDKIVDFRYLDGDSRYELNMRSGFDDICVGRIGAVDTCAYFFNTNNTWYHVTIFSINERILVLVDGELLLDWSDDSGSYFTHGQIGLRGWNGALVRYDNVLVQKIVALSGPAAGVPGTDYTYLATSVPISPTESITYTWQATDFPLVTHVGGITDTLTYNWETPGSKVITTTATTQYGIVVDTYPVTIEDIPITGLRASSSSPTILGETTILTATVISGTNITYTWDLGDGFSAIGDVITHTYEMPGVYTATVTATNSLGEMTAATGVEILPIKTYLPLLVR